MIPTAQVYFSKKPKHYLINQANKMILHCNLINLPSIHTHMPTLIFLWHQQRWNSTCSPSGISNGVMSVNLANNDCTSSEIEIVSNSSSFYSFLQPSQSFSKCPFTITRKFFHSALRYFFLFVKGTKQNFLLFHQNFIHYLILYILRPYQTAKVS